MLVSFFKNVLRYPLIMIGAPILVGLRVSGWFFLIGGAATAVLWFNGEFVGLGWPIVSAVLAGLTMLSLARGCVRTR